MKRLINILHREDGFTLMELMVVTGLLSLLLGAAYFFLQHTILSTQQAYVQTDTQNNLRIAVNRMSREIREASSIKIKGGSSLELLINNNTITYKFDSVGAEIERNDMPVASKIKSLRLDVINNKTIGITVEGPKDLKIYTAVTPRNNPQIVRE
ncbi:hypothetical protein Desca_2175 [Desulfotomaculum nigrificans CO-1-SRB]|uniref:Prepilin-type N-terminal cleavage/methylation domain-containing protein n=1 Tax=Desulfotomaculum nigrificans (strain DSM 14880 / VKM B-2319 / CO-1-SRB) TaxID=868595 RepID=F6BA45_DESCC|nr:prepilin-type N-terminal cleavage/methylation domain-containing protein [Desulfotomaculum nigrificans]AEF95014.1 hypothetical protein Desca_2175 [Desulfotomaculum nigrificans CO-1-SRB]